MAVREKKKLDSATGLSRREFFKTGAAAGVGAAVIAGGTSAAAQSNDEWDYEYDIVVCGGGCTGLPAAIRARDLGASVLVIEQNFDLGGRMLHSAGMISLGGGDSHQLRDIAGEADPDGFISVAPIHAPEDITEDVDHLFRDMVDWSIVDGAAQSPYRYNDRGPHRAWADNAPDVRDFLAENYVRMARISGTHGTGGMTRARRATAFMMLGEETNPAIGTVTADDAGNPGEIGSHFAPSSMANQTSNVGPGSVGNGTAMARPLEYSAREKGVEFILNRHMDTIIREEPNAGRVLGVTASYTPRFDPDTGEQLTSLWSNGNIDETRETIRIRARKAVVIGTGGYSGNPELRSMFYPAMNDPFYVHSGWALLGPLGMDGSGIAAAMAVGANMGGMFQALSYNTCFHVHPRMGVRDNYTNMAPGHPTFPFRKAIGHTCNANTMQNMVAVNQVGKRFFHEQDLMRRHAAATYPGGNVAPNAGIDIVQGDWRNCSVEHIRSMYAKNHGFDAMIAINEGSEGPEYYAGSHWVIFDQDAVERGELDIREPVISYENGYFFRADTIEELADAIYNDSHEQRVPLVHLADTIEQWNEMVANGEDPEFERHNEAPMHEIGTPPFYAALISPVWHDSYGGVRNNERHQATDTKGEVIPGLYVGGEASGSGNQHGLGRCAAHGYIIGTHAAAEEA